MNCNRDMLKVLCNKIKQEQISPTNRGSVSGIAGDGDIVPDVEPAQAQAQAPAPAPAPAPIADAIVNSGRKRKSWSSTEGTNVVTPTGDGNDSESPLSALCFIAEVVDTNTSGKPKASSASKASSMAYAVGNPVRRRARAATISSFGPPNAPQGGSVQGHGRESGRASHSGSVDDDDIQALELQRSVKRRILNGSMKSTVSTTGSGSGGVYEGEADVAALLASLSNNTNMDLNSPVRNRSNSTVTAGDMSHTRSSRRPAPSSSILARETLSRTTVTSALKFAGSTITFPRRNADYIRKQPPAKGGDGKNPPSNGEGPTAGAGSSGRNSANTTISSVNRHFRDVCIGLEVDRQASGSDDSDPSDGGSKAGRGLSLGSVADTMAAAAAADTERGNPHSHSGHSTSTTSESDSPPSDGSDSVIAHESDDNEEPDEEDKYYYSQICNTLNDFFTAKGGSGGEAPAEAGARSSAEAAGAEVDQFSSHMTAIRNLSSVAANASEVEVRGGAEDEDEDQSRGSHGHSHGHDVDSESDDIASGSDVNLNDMNISLDQDRLSMGSGSTSMGSAGSPHQFLLNISQEFDHNGSVCLNGSLLNGKDSAAAAAMAVEASNELKFIGAYSPDERYKRLIKFFSKRNRRLWTKRVKYDVRKNFADSRVRVKGRFVRKEDEEFLMKEHQEGQEEGDSPTPTPAPTATATADSAPVEVAAVASGSSEQGTSLAEDRADSKNSNAASALISLMVNTK